MPRPNVRDANLAVSIAGPVGAVTVITATGIDIGPLTSMGDFAPCVDGELLLEVPAQAVGALPNATTITYDIVESATSVLGSPVVVRKAAIIQTGAGGVGAAAASVRYRPATNAARYYGFQATGVATVSAAGTSGKLSYVF